MSSSSSSSPTLCSWCASWHSRTSRSSCASTLSSPQASWAELRSLLTCAGLIESLSTTPPIAPIIQLPPALGCREKLGRKRQYRSGFPRCSYRCGPLCVFDLIPAGDHRLDVRERSVAGRRQVDVRNDEDQHHEGRRRVRQRDRPQRHLQHAAAGQLGVI